MNQKKLLQEYEKLLGTEITCLNKFDSYAYPKEEGNNYLLPIGRVSLWDKGQVVIAIQKPIGLICFDFESELAHKDITDRKVIAREWKEILEKATKFFNYLSLKQIPAIISDSGRGLHLEILSNITAPKLEKAVFNYLVKDSGLVEKENAKHYYLGNGVVVGKELHKRSGRNLFRVMGSLHPKVRCFKSVLTKKEKVWIERLEDVVYPEKIELYTLSDEILEGMRYEPKKKKEAVVSTKPIKFEGKDCVEEILQNPKATHEDRIALMLILKNGRKISAEQTKALIKEKGKWTDYKEGENNKQVDSIYSKAKYNKPPKFATIKAYCVHCKNCFYSRIETVETKTPTKIKGISVFRKPTEIHVHSELYSCIAQKNINGIEEFKPIYKIYELVVGAGNRKRYLVLTPFQKAKLGDAKLYLERLNAEEKNGYSEMELLNENTPEIWILHKICKEYDIPICKEAEKDVYYFSRSELMQKIAEQQLKAPFFFKLALGCKTEEVLKLGKRKMQELIEDHITNGYDVDSRIAKLFKPALFNPNSKLIEPKNYAKYSDHKIIITNTKVGKSYIAQRTGRVFENASISNLLGFATAESVIEGSLHNLTESVAFDEVMEERNESALSKMNSLMEFGECEIARGKKAIRTKCYSSFKFMGNPKSEEEKESVAVEGQQTLVFTEELLTLYLGDTLKKISTNYRALGSRIGLILFDNDIPAVSQSRGFDMETVEELNSFFGTVQELAKDNYTKLFLNQRALNWLDAGFDEQYLKTVNEIRAKITLNSINQFILGHLDAHRHLRGCALKLACIDHIKEILLGEVDIKKLLVSADRKVEELQALNIKSFKNMGAGLSDELLKRYYKYDLRNKSNHIQILIEAVIEWNKVNKKEGRVLITESELEPFLKLHPLIKEHKYSLSNVFELLYKDLRKTNLVLSEYSVGITQTEGFNVIDVRDWHILNLISEEEGENGGK